MRDSGTFATRKHPTIFEHIEHLLVRYRFFFVVYPVHGGIWNDKIVSPFQRGYLSALIDYVSSIFTRMLLSGEIDSILIWIDACHESFVADFIC